MGRGAESSTPIAAAGRCRRVLRGAAGLALGLLLVLPASLYAGAACVMAKYQGQTLDYALVVRPGHPSLAQAEAEQELRDKGYAEYRARLDIIRAQNLTARDAGFVVVIRSEFQDARGRDRSAMGCGFGADADAALWDALRDAQAYYWGWKPDRDGYEVLVNRRFP